MVLPQYLRHIHTTEHVLRLRNLNVLSDSMRLEFDNVVLSD